MKQKTFPRVIVATAGLLLFSHVPGYAQGLAVKPSSTQITSKSFLSPFFKRSTKVETPLRNTDDIQRVDTNNRKQQTISEDQKKSLKRVLIPNFNIEEGTFSATELDAKSRSSFIVLPGQFSNNVEATKPAFNKYGLKLKELGSLGPMQTAILPPGDYNLKEGTTVKGHIIGVTSDMLRNTQIKVSDQPVNLKVGANVVFNGAMIEDVNIIHDGNIYFSGYNYVRDVDFSGKGQIIVKANAPVETAPEMHVLSSFTPTGPASLIMEDSTKECGGNGSGVGAPTDASDNNVEFTGMTMKPYASAIFSNVTFKMCNLGVHLFGPNYIQMDHSTFDDVTAGIWFDCPAETDPAYQDCLTTPSDGFVNTTEFKEAYFAGTSAGIVLSIGHPSISTNNTFSDSVKVGILNLSGQTAQELHYFPLNALGNTWRFPTDGPDSSMTIPVTKLSYGWPLWMAGDPVMGKGKNVVNVSDSSSNSSSGTVTPAVKMQIDPADTAGCSLLRGP